MFPLSDSIKASRFAYLNVFLVVVTIFVFIQEIAAPDPNKFIEQYALIPSLIDFSNYKTLTPFVTAIFLHGGFLHILSNMWFLIIFGNNVEDALPPLSFIFLYFLAGIAGNLAQYLIMPDATIPILGASGAVAGVLGCYFVLFPYARIKTLIFIFFFVTIVDISATIMLGYWFILQIISGVTSLPGFEAEGGVAFFAHVAGFIIGIFYGMLYKSRVNKRFATD